MKKGIAFVITSALLITLLAGCKGSAGFTSIKNKPIINEPYKLYLESNLLEDYSTERLGYLVIDDNYFTALDDIPDKTVTLFGKTHTFAYYQTCVSTVPSRNSVSYKIRYAETDDLYMADFDAATGALRSYINFQAGNDRSYQSEVNEYSSEAEFLAYAKKMISQYASVEGCEVEIKTELYEYDEEYGYYKHDRTVDGYVNNAENIPDFNARYEFTFYKTIDGVRRYDTNCIEIINTGEVASASLYMQDELYDDFTNIDIDMEQAERLIYETLPSGEIVDCFAVVTNDGVLWLHFVVFQEIVDSAGSCNQYVITIAGEYRK